MSFAFYMVQYPVMVWVTRTFIGGKSYGWAGWLGFSVLAFVVSLIVSGLVYTYVDKPIMKNWARPKKTGGPTQKLSLIHISEPTRPCGTSRMPSSA